jgi:hypothetical protein
MSEPIPFDFNNKYTIQVINNIKFIKLRLCDANLWNIILSNIFKSDIVIIHDYKTEDKVIGELYNRFKLEYKIPSNYIDMIKSDKYFNFYYNEVERNIYLNIWYTKMTNENIPYTFSEFNFYMNLCLENQYINDIQFDHYIDNGCFCKHCSQKRKEIYFRAKTGQKKFDKIIHRELIQEVQTNKINLKLKEFINKKVNNKFRANQFAINVSNK